MHTPIWIKHDTPIGGRSMSFTTELLVFMGTMLLYISTVSLYLIVVLWEYLGMLSYVLIQH